MAGTYESGEAGPAPGAMTGAGEAAAARGTVEPDSVVTVGDKALGNDPVEVGGVVEDGSAFWAEGAGDLEADTAELIGQIRQLAAHDPAGVQQVVADVLAALDRVTDGAVSEQLPEGSVLANGGTADAV